MKKRVLLVGTLAVFGLASAAYAMSMFREVRPFEFDPERTFLVQAEWLTGIGCPTNARTAVFDASQPDNASPGPNYTDPACQTGDPRDRRNEGLLLAKTGPTANFAAAGAELKNVQGIVLTELGYDLRKPGLNNDDIRGSHCGNGAPRFNVETKDGGFYFIGCNNSPEPTTTKPGVGYMRLRWGTGAAGSVLGVNAFTGVTEPITARVKSITIIFDEGYDTGPDNFGAAVLDNIDVNGVLVGRGSHGDDRNPEADDDDDRGHRGGHNDNGDFEDDDDLDGAPDGWKSQNTGAGTTSWGTNGVNGSRGVSISGNGGNAALLGSPTWTSAPFAASPGTVLDLDVSALTVGASSAPSAGLVFYGPLGNVLNDVSLATAPLTTTGTAFKKLLSLSAAVPAGATEASVVLRGFSATDTSTAGTVTFDNVRVFDPLTRRLSVLPSIR
jgi:hypothetical protein